MIEDLAAGVVALALVVLVLCCIDLTRMTRKRR